MTGIKQLRLRQMHFIYVMSFANKLQVCGKIIFSNQQKAKVETIELSLKIQLLKNSTFTKP